MPADDHDTVDVMATGASKTLDDRLDPTEVTVAANTAAIAALVVALAALDERVVVLEEA